MAVGVGQTWAEILALPLSGRVTSVAPVACGEDTEGCTPPGAKPAPCEAQCTALQDPARRRRPRIRFPLRPERTAAAPTA